LKAGILGVVHRRAFRSRQQLDQHVVERVQLRGLLVDFLLVDFFDIFSLALIHSVIAKCRN
jgi:hypothetical protein